MSERNIESYIAEIAANTEKTAHYLKDMRALLTDHRIKEVFMESQCDHSIGHQLIASLNSPRESVIVKQSQNQPNYKINKLFYFCPDCGNKLR